MLLARVYVGQSTIAGQGVFTSTRVSPGGKIIEVDDSDVIDDRRPLRPDLGEFEHHCDQIEDGKIILLKPPVRFINHCCDPNAYCRVINGVRYVVARREIVPGEEITCDYGVNSAIPDYTWDCGCGSPRCRGRAGIDFFALPKERQQEYRPLLDEWFVREHQQRLEALWGSQA